MSGYVLYANIMLYAIYYAKAELTMTQAGPWSPPHLYSVLVVKPSVAICSCPTLAPMCLAEGCKNQDDIWGCAE